MLNIVHKTWEERAERWCSKEKQQVMEEIPKLKEDIQMLDKHIQGMQQLTEALAGFHHLKAKLDALYMEALVLCTKEGGDPLLKRCGGMELQKIDNELRCGLHVDYSFEMQYFKKRFDYRCPDLPLPHGFRCHKQYQKEIEEMNHLMTGLLSEAEDKRKEIALLIRTTPTTKEPAEEEKPKVSLYMCMLFAPDHHVCA